jgi:two-component system, LuxR family, secretion system response regulator SsrB
MPRSRSVLWVGTHQLFDNDGGNGWSQISDIQIIKVHSLSETVLAEAIAQHQPMLLVVVLGASTPEEYSLTQAARHRFPHLKIIVLTALTEIALFRAFEALGVHGYLLGGLGQAEFLEAVTAVLEGQRYFDARLGARTEASALNSPNVLTSREAQIVRLVKQGLSLRDIIEATGFGEATIETHLRNIFFKLRVDSLAALARTEVL